MSHQRVRMVLAAFTGLALLAVLVVGCSLGGAMSGAKMGMNLSKRDSNLRILLDGQEAKQSKLKKAVKGYSAWEIKDPVNTSPVLRFSFIKPEKFGRITGTYINIFKMTGGQYSDQAEFAVAPADNKPESLMKPDTDYDLGKPPASLKVLDLRGNVVEGVKLEPGMKYKFILVIAADKSETAQVEFETK